MELSQKIRTQKTFLLANVFSFFFTLACFSCGMIFTLQYRMAMSPMSASTAHKTLTDDQQTPSTSGINIARSIHDIEYAEVGENNSYIMEKEKHCEIAFVLSKSEKK